MTSFTHRYDVIQPPGQAGHLPKTDGAPPPAQIIDDDVTLIGSKAAAPGPWHSEDSD